LSKDNPVTDLLPALRVAVGDAHVLTDPSIMEQFCIDWARRFGGAARAVVRPGSTAEVAQVLATCQAAGVPVIPQGGNTGLVAGSVPAETSDVLPVVL